MQRVQNFCTNELGSLYLDITKDRLYTMPDDSRGRRSAQSAMYRILEAMVRWLAPILQFHGRGDLEGDAWRTFGESVLFETWYDGLEPVQGSPEQREAWAELLAIRAAVGEAARSHARRRGNRRVARSRSDAVCGSPFAAILSNDQKQAMEELRFFFITSGLKVEAPSAKPDDAVEQKTERLSYWVSAKRSSDQKCIRCWHLRPDYGIDAAHPEICGRCVTNCRASGETRLFF